MYNQTTCLLTQSDFLTQTDISQSALSQSATIKRDLKLEGLAPFVPHDPATLVNSPNVLDQWINSATQSLVHFVRQEMDAYRLYTVVPYLLKFIDNLTNIYVRFNRKRLKGRTGENDCRTALSTLYHVLLTVCKVMAPFTPFFTEMLYRNMRKVATGSEEESIHFCTFPQVEGKGGSRMEESVDRMMKIIDLARIIREHHNRSLKTPLREMIVVHPDAEFLNDITGKLKEYVLEEVNVLSVVPCTDLLKYACLRAEPDFSVLGKRLGKSMGEVSKAVKAMSREEILSFEKAGQVTIANHCLKLSDIKIIRRFKCPDGVTEEQMDGSVDGDVLVALDLRLDDSLLAAGFAREVVSRIQKLRRDSKLRPTDSVEVYFKSLDQDASVASQMLKSQEAYIKEAIGSPILDSSLIPQHAVMIGEETYRNVSNCDFQITLSRPALAFNDKAVLDLYTGNAKYAEALKVYLLSRDHSNLKSEFRLGNRKIKVDCIETLPHVDVILGKHVFLTVGDYYTNYTS